MSLKLNLHKVTENHALIHRCRKVRPTHNRLSRDRRENNNFIQIHAVITILNNGGGKR